MSNMDAARVADQLSALAQVTRLNVLRMLIKVGKDGVPATEIAERLGVRQNLMSSHLSSLVRSGLTRTRREGRRVYHSINLEATNALLSFLNEELNAERTALGFPAMLKKTEKRRSA